MSSPLGPGSLLCSWRLGLSSGSPSSSPPRPLSFYSFSWPSGHLSMPFRMKVFNVRIKISTQLLSECERATEGGSSEKRALRLPGPSLSSFSGNLTHTPDLGGTRISETQESSLVLWCCSPNLSLLSSLFPLPFSTPFRSLS